MASAGKCRTGQDTAAAVGPTSIEPEVLLDRLPPEVLLDRLPPELLLHIFSWLDWLCLVALESVSARCKEAVALYLGRLRLFTVDGSLWKKFCAVWRPGLLPRMAGPMSQPSEPVSALTALLSRMVNLRELHVYVDSKVERPLDLLAAVVSASRHWPLLERLKLTWYAELRRDLLLRLCASCARLTGVTLDGNGFSNEQINAVVTNLPALRTLQVTKNSVLSSSFLSKLPTGLHNLSLNCRSTPGGSWPRLSDLLRCRELRSLELQWSVGSQPPEPAELVSVLVGCVHLKSLSLFILYEAFVACLPPDGLPTLRHLTIDICFLNDAGFSRLVKRLPGLESVSLGYCDDLTPQGLTPLGRLPSLRVLRLDDDYSGCVSDWLLTQLSTAPLVELRLSAEPLLYEPNCKRMGIAKNLTVDGLLHMIRNCMSLRVLILFSGKFTREQRVSISCGAGVQERDVEQAIRLFVDTVARR